MSEVRLLPVGGLLALSRVASLLSGESTLESPVPPMTRSDKMAAKLLQRSATTAHGHHRAARASHLAPRLYAEITTSAYKQGKK